MPVKKPARSNEPAEESNPRRLVENWIRDGLSRRRILRMLEAFHGFEPGHSRRLYFLVESECSQLDRR